jgi:lysophospholipase L1-like esterase
LINDFQYTPVEVLNMGIGGNVISVKSPSYEKSGKPAANERLERHVIEKRPDLLIISYGLNDARGGTPLPLFKEEMIRLIRRVREKVDPVIVLLGPYYMIDFERGGPAWSHGSLDLFKKFNKGIAEVAEQENCLYVNLLDAYQETDWMIHYDGVHANDLGHQIVANRIFEVLAQNCYGLAKKTKEIEKASPRWRDESVLKRGFE